MKKLLLFLVVIMSLTGCRKVYTCRCYTTATYKTAGGNLKTELFPGSNSQYSEAFTKREAQTSCRSEEMAISATITKWYTANGAHPLDEGESITTTCSIEN